ncbi:hypothetical protein [Vibrio viridaestus]|uniref:Uncharacterized protein n=1 Tax=Vibrio viridaestus TaxID=2487322 RepID=A0A3N9TDE5_9VIBR|nr:hypothetical protein [Vibrio viridaestus]RQW61713.1 hypothetical protein EES38_17785 [Vibrio viridaestus]
MIEQYAYLFKIYNSFLYATLKSKNIDNILFLARGGIRLRAVFSKTHSDYLLSVKSNVCYTSRLAAIKACSYVAPDITSYDLAKEYYGMSLYSMLQCFLGSHSFGEYKACTSTDKLERLHNTQVCYSSVNDLLSIEDGDLFLREYVFNQYNLFFSYWKQLVDKKDKIALVDTGWSGSIVFYLKVLFPNYNINAFFVGKSTYGGPEFNFHKFVHGIMFDSYQENISQGFSYIIENRHIIEMLCEPEHPSTETYIKVEGLITPECGFIDDSNVLGDISSIFYQVYNKIDDIDDELSTLYLGKLRKQILWPSKNELFNYLSISRSADFGKDLKVNMILDKEINLKGKYINIKRSLWKQGQIVQEFGMLGRFYLRFKYNLKKRIFAVINIIL